jgi:siroheme synthase-like protein
MYPVFLDLASRLAVVIGAGPVGRRRAEGLLLAGARVRVVALQRPEGWAVPVEFVVSPFMPDHLDGASLVIAAAPAEVNVQVVHAARERGILVNNAADATNCDFHVPAVFSTGPIRVAVSTGGRSPALAARLRDHLAGLIGPEWAEEAEAPDVR